MPMKSAKKPLNISAQQLKALKTRIKDKTLRDDDYHLLTGLTETVECLSRVLAEKEASIGRLVKYLLGAPTETAKNVLKQNKKKQTEKSQEKPKGHGRNGAADYTGADKVTIEHPVLKPGDLCPGCKKGKVYELALPSVFVHITGAAPLKATIFERIRLRCNLCGEIFTPELPAQVSDKKHDDSAAAMLGLLKYGCGLPLHRLQKLQGNLGQPLPASTQWDILNASAISLAPVHDALINFAAHGELVHNDDTTMKVLSFLKEQNPQSSRKGIFTSGIVSKWQDHHIALFMTGNQHAGENLNDLLKHRATGLSPPVQMCDGASRNESKDYETILVNCLTHARRNFVELVVSFPEDCAYVIEQLGAVYHNDAVAKKQGMSDQERLLYHQQHSAPVMAELKSWCSQQIGEKIVEPNSGLGKAINYMLKRWDKLTGFLKIAGAPLDNNLCERALKHAILHRKNALFYRTQRGAYVGDLFISLIHTCQLSGVNPLDYLTYLLKNAGKLEKSPDHYMPWNYNQFL